MFIIAAILFLASELAFGQCPDAEFSIPLLGKFSAAFVSGMVALRGVSELLMKLAPLTRYGVIATKVATILGLFGIGSPKKPCLKGEDNGAGN